MAAEDDPVFEKESFPCECGGNISKNNAHDWECSSCDFIASGEPLEFPRD